jgi:anti-sigma factor RsiW
MTTLCEALEAALSETASGEGRGAARSVAGLSVELTAHVSVCPRCRELLAVHESLATLFVERPVPQLSPGFEARLERRLVAETGPGTRWVRRLLPRHWAGWVYPLYWVGAAAGTYAVLASAELPTALSPEALGAVLGFGSLTLAGLALPVWAMVRGWLRTPLPPLPK